MTIIGDAYIAVKGDTKGFTPSVEKGVLSSVTSLAKKAAVIFGGAFVAREVFQGLKSAVEAGTESNKVAADTAQVIQSTGSAANVTADQVEKLATAISLKTGVDDEAIQSAQNMLLTFTNLRNEAGKGNDIFTQASRIAVDMGAKFKNGPEAASIQLGKALNDPIKGITALTRVGVTFDEQQRAQIKTMVESGNIMGAQKVILAELSKEFGGQAEAQASAIDKIKVAAGNLKETLGQAIIPAIDAIVPVIQSVMDQIGPVLEVVGKNIGTVFEALAPALGPIAEAITPVIAEVATTVRDLAPTVVGAIESILPLLNPVVEILSGTFSTIVQAVAPIIGTLAEALTPILERLATMFDDLLKAAGPAIVEVVGAIVGVIEELAPVVLEVLDAFEPLIPVIAEIAKVLADVLVTALEAAGPLIKDMAEQFGGALVELLPVVADAILAVVEALKPLLTKENIEGLLALASPFFLMFKAMQPLIPVIAKVVGVLGEVIAQLIEKLEPVLPPIMDAVTQLAEAFGNGLADVLEALLPALPPLVEALGEILIAILPLIPPFVQLATLLLEKIGVPVLVAVATAIAVVAEAIAKVVGWVARLVSGLTSLDFGKMADGAGAAVGAVVGFFTDLPGKIFDTLGGLGSTLTDAVSGAVSWLMGGIDAVFQPLWDFYTFLPRKVFEFLTGDKEGLGAKLKEAVTDAIPKMVEGIGDLLTSFREEVGKLPGKLGEVGILLAAKAGEIGGTMWDFLVEGIGGLVDGVADFADKFLTAIKKAWNAVIDFANPIWNKIELDLGPLGTLGLPDDVLLALKFEGLAKGGLIKRTPGGIPAMVGEGNYDEAVVPLPPGLLEGLRTLASGQAVGSRGPLYNIEKLEQVMPEGSTGEQALAFLDDLELAAWAAGVGAP